MSNQNEEWVGGKQVYPVKPTKKEKSKTDDWLSEFSEEDLGISRTGFKGSRKVQKESK